MFCQKCGTQIPEGNHYCPICGEPVGVKEKAPDISDHTAMFTPEDIERSRYLAALGYLSFLFVILGLLIEPNSKFLRYHINQAIILYVFGILCAVVCIVPVIGWIAGGIGSIASIVFVVMGIIRAVKGEAKDIPLIGKYTVVHYD